MTKKFRVWDIQDKSFFSKEYLKEFKVSVSWDGQTIRQDFWGGTKTIGEDVIVQQWTGLTDSQGVEIYEGDIVKALFPEDQIIKEIIYSKEYAAFLLGENALWQGWLGNSKVIGNIFQTPELLEKS